MNPRHRAARELEWRLVLTTKLRMQAYAPAMDPAWYLPTALAVLFAASIVLGLMSADSRPGFLTGRFDKKEHSFWHPKDP